MNNIAISTDSTANLPSEWVKQYAIRIIQLKSHGESKTYLDGIDLTPEEFYMHLSNNKSLSKSLSTTSQPSFQDFLLAFNSLADEGATGIVVPLISSGISGTVDSARHAASMIARVSAEIIDNHITPMEQVLIILAAARYAEQGASLQGVRQAADEVVRRLKVFFAVDTLEYLHRGGRINGTSRYFGNALGIIIDALERVRTKKKALQRLITFAEQQANRHTVQVGIVHANVPQTTQGFSSEVDQRLNCKEFFAVEFCPVISAHVGPGASGIALYSNYLNRLRRIICVPCFNEVS